MKRLQLEQMPTISEDDECGCATDIFFGGMATFGLKIIGFATGAAIC